MGGNYHKISPRHSFPKRGIVPPFGKGSLPAFGGAGGDQGLGGIFPTITIPLIEGFPEINYFY